NLNQARVNLERTRILFPVNGYVTKLLTQVGDYINVGQKTISVVDADSFWVDGYFEETNIQEIHKGDIAAIKFSRPRRQYRPTHQQPECAARPRRRRIGKSDLYMGPFGAACASAHSHR